MELEWFRFTDNWQEVKNTTMTTIGKSKGKYPDSQWKLKLLMSEHSPIRKLKFAWRWKELPYWVSVHFVRHKFGIEHFVMTQRTDRTGTTRDELTQGAHVLHECEANAQTMIAISRKRLCSCASPETREAWQLVKDEVEKNVPELAHCMVKECVYRGFCPEMFGCGFANTEAFAKELAAYRNLEACELS